MADSRPRVVVLASHKAQVTEALTDLLPLIKRFAGHVTVDDSFNFDFQAAEQDLVVTFGGDGTILQAARQMGANQLPVVGVNLGRLGFLAALSIERFVEMWPSICGGKYEVTDHIMLECCVERNGQLLGKQIGLNEAAILGGPPYSIMQIDLFVDGQLATTYSCDGLIISTPVGSTAHNLSAGGPILRKNLEAFVISPISPHTLTMRPVVDTADRVFELAIREHHDSATVVVDGRIVERLSPDDRIRIKRAESVFQLVTDPQKNDYETLRDKLGWSGIARGKRL